MRRVPFLVIVALAAGCGSSTTQPTTNVSLRDGTYQLELIGYESPVVNGTTVTSCAGLGTMSLETTAAHVAIQRSGDTWSGRAASAADGNFDLQLQRTGATIGSFTDTVTGSIAGTVNNTVTLLGLVGAFVTFGQTPGSRVTLTGFVGTQMGAGSGTITGDVVFTGTDGTLLHCAPGVQWTLVGPI